MSGGGVKFEGDFFADARVQFIATLNSIGLQVDPSATVEQVFRIYENVNHRAIEATPRPVSWSTQLQAKAISEPVRKGLDRITLTSLAGGDLLPFQSRQLAHGLFTHGPKSNADASTPDGLLNAWGINHLHLGEVNENGLVKGLDTGEIVFVWVGSERLYFVDVLDHLAFAEPELVEIIDSNWPELIARMLTDLRDSSLTPRQQKEIRKQGGNTLLTCRSGRSYFPPGGGQMANGLSSRVLRLADMRIAHVATLQRRLASHPDDLRRAIETRRGRPIEDLRIQLALTEEGPFAIHVSTGTRVPLPRTLAHAEIWPDGLQL